MTMISYHYISLS